MIYVREASFAGNSVKVIGLGEQSGELSHHIISRINSKTVNSALRSSAEAFLGGTLSN